MLRFLKKNSLAYFRTVKQPSAQRRVAIIFENHLGCMIWVVCYENLKSNWAHQIKHSVQDAYQSVAVYGFTTVKKMRDYSAKVVGNFSNQLTCFTTDRDVLLVESVRMLLFQGRAHYEAHASKIILQNISPISSSHKMHCVQQLTIMLNQITAEEDREEIFALLSILIKYQWLKAKRTVMDKRGDAKQQLLLDKQLQKECFAKPLTDVLSLARYCSVTGPLQLLDLMHKLDSSRNGKKLIATLTKEKKKQQDDLQAWTTSLTQQVPSQSHLAMLVQSLYYCYQRSPVCLSGSLAIFCLHILKNNAKLAETHFLHRMDPIVFLIGAAVGLWQLTTQNLFILPFMTAVSFFAESLYSSLQNEQLDLVNASWRANELPFSLSTLLKGVLLFISFVFSFYLLDVSPLVTMLSSVSITFFFEQLFFLLMHGITFPSQHEKIFFEFLFLQICLASVMDIQNRYTQREEATAQFAALSDSQNIQTDFSWRWWFFGKNFDVIHSNATHTRVMHCALPDESMDLTGNLRDLPFCTLAAERPRLAPVL